MTMREEIRQANSCALCGGPLVPTSPAEDEVPQPQVSGEPPVCSRCESRLHYGENSPQGASRP